MDPTVIISNSVFSGANAIDGVSLMTYDLGLVGKRSGESVSGRTLLAGVCRGCRRSLVRTAWFAKRSSLGVRHVGKQRSDGEIRRRFAVLRAHGDRSGYQPRTYSELVAGGTTTDANYFTYQGRSLGFPARHWRSSAFNSRTITACSTSLFGNWARICRQATRIHCCDRAYTKNLGLTPVAGDYDADRDVDADRLRDMAKSCSVRPASAGPPMAIGNQVVDAADYVHLAKDMHQSAEAAHPRSLPCRSRHAVVAADCS